LVRIGSIEIAQSGLELLIHSIISPEIFMIYAQSRIGKQIGIEPETSESSAAKDTLTEKPK